MRHVVSIILVAVALAIQPIPADALGLRTFISPTGNDANPCNLAAPCRFLQAALAQTAPGGEIAILGTAGYNNGATVTITQSVSIVNPGAFEAGLFVLSGGTGIVVSAGANDAVSLRGLTIEGGGVGATGIQFNSGKSLTIENSAIRHLTGNGINFLPNANSALSVSNTVVADNGSRGINVAPSGSGTVTAVFNRVQVNNSGDHGLLLDGSGSTGTLSGAVYDSIAAGNANAGFYDFSDVSKATTTLMVFQSVSTNNGFGLYGGTNAILRVSLSAITGNINGYVTGIGGGVISAGDNTIEANGTNQTAPPTYARK
jgi:hypothetical protein